MDGTTSGAHHKSKRLEIESLAEEKTDQHVQHKCTMTDSPGPPKRLSSTQRMPTEHVDPPHRREQLKTKPTKVSTSKQNYQVVQYH